MDILVLTLVFMIIILLLILINRNESKDNYYYSNLITPRPLFWDNWWPLWGSGIGNYYHSTINSRHNHKYYNRRERRENRRQRRENRRRHR